MALKKSQLYSKIWQACDALRGGMDASEYKNYVLTLLFVRYLSDKYANDPNSIVSIPEGARFSDLSALKGKPNIGEEINKVLHKIAEANNLKGIIDAVDFNDESKLGKGKEQVDKLSGLIAIFESPELDFSKNTAEGDDLLGDAYEYLMKNFAVESGKSKGQFYTPAEVSRLIAKLVEASKATSNSQTAYDPTCGSGSLLLKVATEAKPVNLTLFGQEKDNNTHALAVLNMWLHNEPTADIRKGNTLTEPAFTEYGALKKFDFVVANPPFSQKNWMQGLDPEHDLYDRFEGFGIPPAKNGDYAFLLHIVKSLKSTGKGAVVLPHGVLFRGNAEAQIRQNLVKCGYIKGIIGLPANLFFGTGIPACIVVLDKEKAAERQGIFMIDASKGYRKDGNKNRLRDQDIEKILDIWQSQEEVPGFSHFATLEEIEKNEYNLNLPRYIENIDQEDEQSIDGHLYGGIPVKDVEGLKNFWQVCPKLKYEIFTPLRDGFVSLKVDTDNLGETIQENAEFLSFKNKTQETLRQWQKVQREYLTSLDSDVRPKEVFVKLGQALKTAFAENPLLDKYDVFQVLADYWQEIMQDDVYVIVSDGWLAGKEVIRLTKENKNKKKAEIKGLAGLEGRLIPVDLLIKTYFANQWEDLEKAKQDQEEAKARMDEIKEEHGGEDGLLSDLVSESGNIPKKELLARLKKLQRSQNLGELDEEEKEELAVLQEYAQNLEKEAQAKKETKEKEAELERLVLQKYPTLTEEEIKDLVINKKWFVAIDERINDLLEQTAYNTSARLKELAQRYEETLPEINKKVEELENKVTKHLEEMGFKVK